MAGAHSVENLLRWLSTFDVASHVKSVDDVSDGLVLGKVLSSISPKRFPLDWLRQLSSGSNLDWESKVLNLENVFRAAVEFFSEVQDEHIVVKTKPDLVSIAKYNDEAAAFELLQLILGCAVNCEAKETYIEKIMCMEESVQHVIMQAIQELMSAQDFGLEGVSELREETIFSPKQEYRELLVEKESLAQRCHELEIKCSMLASEKATLQLELDRLRQMQDILPSTEMSVPTGDGLISELKTADPITSLTVANVRVSQLQDQVTKLRDELYHVESVKEELKVKLVDSLSTTQDLRQKCDLLSLQTEEVNHLKDELDMAREELSAASYLSSTVDQLRKRADEASELRTRCAKLEADNKVCMDRIAQLENEARITSSIRSQAEMQRLQANSARAEATEAIQRTKAVETELHKIREELSSSRREKERIVNEFNRLRTCCEQLLAAHLDEKKMFPGSDLHLPSALHSQMITLSEEVTRSRVSLPNSEVAIEHEFDELPVVTTTESPSVVHDGLDITSTAGHVKIVGDSPDVQTIAALEAKLSQKETELELMEQRYRSYLWKARSVIQLLQRKNETDTRGESDNGIQDEVGRLRALLVEKENVISRLERHYEQTRRHRDAEENMLISAWYNLGICRTRDAIEERLREKVPLINGSLNACDRPSNGSADVSFLELQRELHLKPPRGVTSVVTARR